MALNYDAIAPAYDTFRKGGGFYFPVLLRLDPAAIPGPALELAAGTGNNTACFLAQQGGDLIALERSAGMARRAREKAVGGAWLQGDACHLPLAASQFRFIFATYLLHHIADLDRLMGECLRVLKPGGVAAFVSVPTSFIESHPMNQYFPSFARVDLARFQPFREIMRAMDRAGFDGVLARRCVDQPRSIDTSYVERVAQQFISTYALLPEEEFRTGLAQLRSDVARLGALDTPVIREAIVVWGRKAENIATCNTIDT